MTEHTSNKRSYNVFFNTHTVSGIVISVGLYVIFLAGAFALFQNPINNWEINAPGKHFSPNDLDYDRVLEAIAEKGYQLYGRDFNIGLRENHGTYISVFANPPANKISADSLSQLPGSDSLSYVESTAKIDFIVDADSYTLTRPNDENGAQQRIGRMLTHLHYFFQVPVIGLFLSNLVSLFFLFAIVTGVIIHWKKIISNFFTFRLKSSIKNLWTDAHTALGVLGIPFQFMYAVTGTMFGLGVVLFPVVLIVYGDTNKATEILLPERKTYDLLGENTEQVPITPLVQKGFANIQGYEVKMFQVLVKSYGDQNAHLTVVGYADTKQDFASKTISTFSLVDGTLISHKPYGESSFLTSSIDYFIQLHFGNFGGRYVQVIYFILAIITCFVIVSGVMVWLTAREKKMYTHKAKFNRNVGALYLGACLGLYPAIALLFITAKVLPLDMDGRFQFINYAFFGFWLAYTIYAYFIKNNFKVNKHALVLAGVFGLAIPLVNGVVTGLWFWKSPGMGYTDSFFVDVSWLVLSLVTLWAVVKIKPVEKKKKATEPTGEEKTTIKSIPKLLEKDPVLTTHPSSN